MPVNQVNTEALRLVVEAAKAHQNQTVQLCNLHGVPCPTDAELDTAIWMMENKLKESKDVC